MSNPLWDALSEVDVSPEARAAAARTAVRNGRMPDAALAVLDPANCPACELQTTTPLIHPWHICGVCGDFMKHWAHRDAHYKKHHPEVTAGCQECKGIGMCDCSGSRYR